MRSALILISVSLQICFEDGPCLVKREGAVFGDEFVFACVHRNGDYLFHFVPARAKFLNDEICVYGSHTREPLRRGPI